VALCLLADCARCGSCGTLASSTTGGSGGTSSGGSSSAASSAGSSSGEGTSGGTTGSSVGTPASGSTGEASASSSGSAGSSSGSSTGGSTTGPPVPCGLGAVWQGNNCLLLGCADSPLGRFCLLSDGGSGSCAGGTCHDLSLFNSDDSSNCGGFGFQCPNGYSCDGGICVDTSCTGSACPVPCVDAGCPAGMVCLPAGDNLCVWSSCGAGTTDQPCDEGVCCDGVCAQTYFDPSNCGACGRSCGDGGVCLSGECEPPPGSCGAGLDNVPCTVAVDTGEAVGYCCEGSCLYGRDSQNCGACGLSCTSCTSDGGCPAGQACAAPGGPARCAPVSCVGSTNGRTCGITGLVPTNPAALDWAETECCGGVCVDLRSDPSNCGACGLACPAGIGCLAGSCVPLVQNCALALEGATCALGQASAIPGYCCGGQCVDLETNNANCGGCAATCPSGTNCDGSGECIGPDGGLGAAAGSSCLVLGDYDNCTTDAGLQGICCGGDCTAASDLYSFSTCATCGFGCPGCVAGCPTGTACVGGGTGTGGNCQLLVCGSRGNGDFCAFGPVVADGAYDPDFCCSQVCTDISQDPNNCGSCGIVCPSGICASAQCVPAGPDGDCLQSCGPWAVCVAGACVDSSCDDPSVYCAAPGGGVGLCARSGPSPALSPPQCIDFANDPLNCGGWGYSCLAGQACTSGVCTGTPPECVHRVGAFCDLDAGEAYVCCPGVGCTDIGSDPANCGACGTACPTGTSCQGGSCT
jgi:hypothetical protein